MDGWLNMVKAPNLNRSSCGIYQPSFGNSISHRSSWSTSLSIHVCGLHVKYRWRRLPVLLRVKPFMVAWIHQELPNSACLVWKVLFPNEMDMFVVCPFRDNTVTPCSDIDFAWFKLYSVGQHLKLITNTVDRTWWIHVKPAYPAWLPKFWLHLPDRELLSKHA